MKKQNVIKTSLIVLGLLGVTSLQCYGSLVPPDVVVENKTSKHLLVDLKITVDYSDGRINPTTEPRDKTTSVSLQPGSKDEVSLPALFYITNTHLIKSYSVRVMDVRFDTALLPKPVQMDLPSNAEHKKFNDNLSHTLTINSGSGNAVTLGWK